jgi:hypothetical protein
MSIFGKTIKVTMVLNDEMSLLASLQIFTIDSYSIVLSVFEYNQHNEMELDIQILKIGKEWVVRSLKVRVTDGSNICNMNKISTRPTITSALFTSLAVMGAQ